jgi:DNA-binding PadR family transcriptional regulator
MITPDESKSQERALTTTSFAVLGLLAVRDHASYELTQQARLSLRYMWPRAESNLYAEAKRLVAAGLATSRQEWTGARRRTICSITEAGQKALNQWLAQPSAGQRYESEAVLKVFFAENGTLDDLRSSIRALHDQALATIEYFGQIADRYAREEGIYPQRFALTAMVARLLGEQQAATARWAAWAEEVVSRWESPSAETAAWGVETLHALGQPLPIAEDPVARVSRTGRPGNQGPHDLPT